MKRHNTLILLSKFHRKVLFVALMSKRNSRPVKGYPTDVLEKAAYVQDFYYHQLRHHFRLETEELFGTAWGRNSQLDIVIHELKAQRKSIRNLIDQLSAGGDLETRLDVIGAALEAHIRKEERQFFQILQQELNEEELLELKTRLNMRLRQLNRDHNFHPQYENLNRPMGMSDQMV